MKGGFVEFVVILILLVQAHPTSSSDFLAPLLSPIFENVCKEVECGKGRCKPTNETGDSFSFGSPFECECESGWKRPGSLKFLPCVIPNCTLNFSCSGGGAAPSPSLSPGSSAHSSSSDPCHWNVCGGHGVCNKSSSGFSYACSCSQGYSNLMNVTTLPCLRECSIGGDCQKLGITMFNKSSTASPPQSSSSLADNVSSRLFQSCRLSMLVVLVSTTIGAQM